MNININQKDLKDAIEKLEKVLNKTSTTIPVINSVLIKAENNEITITAYNLTSSLALNVDGEIIVPGTILIDKSNFKLIKKLSGILNITSINNMGMKNINTEEEKEDIVSNTITIKANRNLKFNSILPEQFPELPQDINEEAFTIPENTFKNKLRIKAFVAKNHFRQVFNGVLILKDDIVASNTHYMVRYKLNAENKCENQLNIPIQSINELDKILDNKNSNEIKFYYSKNENNEMKYLKIQGKGYEYTTRLIEGMFPNYEQVIHQSSYTTINIEKRKLQDTLEFVMEIVKDDKVHPVIFGITDQLEIHTPEYLEKSTSEILPSEITGEEMKICFDSEYMNTILKTINEDKINIEFSGKLSPAGFKGENNEDEIYVLVPVRLREYEEDNVAV
jgi:DNA polymerase-3 subunit beta